MIVRKKLSSIFCRLRASFYKFLSVPRGCEVGGVGKIRVCCGWRCLFKRRTNSSRDEFVRLTISLLSPDMSMAIAVTWDTPKKVERADPIRERGR